MLSSASNRNSFYDPHSQPQALPAQASDYSKVDATASADYNGGSYDTTDHDSYNQDRRVSAASIDIENRLDSLARFGSSFMHPKSNGDSSAFAFAAASTPASAPAHSNYETHVQSQDHYQHQDQYQQQVPPTMPRLRQTPVPPTPSRPKSLQQHSYYDDGQDVAAQSEAQGYLKPDMYPTSSTVSRDVSQDSLDTSNTDLSPEQLAQKRAIKRTRIIAEIIDTERSFLSDMQVLVDVFAEPAQQSGIFSLPDQKILFGNVDLIIATSKQLLEMLEASASSDPEWLGSAFFQMSKNIEASYCEYCKHQEAALTKVADFSSPGTPESIKSFLEQCRANLQGRTGAWDLASLIVKPVQRVLKYPLLIKSLIKETDQDHPDYENLNDAFAAMELVAEKINEVKKRKDIVEKYVEGKGKINIGHGIAKKFGRGAQKLKERIGLSEDSTVDALYNELADKFDKQFESVAELQRALVMWLRVVRDYFEYEITIATSIEELYHIDSIPTLTYGASNGVDYPAMVKKYRAACSRLMTGPFRNAEAAVKTEMVPALGDLLDRFKEPQLVMRKRELKLLDHDRVKAMRAKNDTVDKNLAESADAYASINAQLIEELPKFMTLVSTFVNEVLGLIVTVQADLFDNIRQTVDPLADELHISMMEDTQSIAKRFRDHMAVGGPIELATRNIITMQRWRSDVWGFEYHVSYDSDSPDRGNTRSLSRSSNGERRRTGLASMLFGSPKSSRVTSPRVSEFQHQSEPQLLDLSGS
eukprot:jgi/Hompol1/7060/HPOL_001538-RA